MTDPTAYLVTDATSSAPLAVVLAPDAVAALSRWSLSEGFAPYADEGDDSVDAYSLHRGDDGTASAPFANHEIRAEPLPLVGAGGDVEPLETLRGVLAGMRSHAASFGLHGDLFRQGYVLAFDEALGALAHVDGRCARCRRATDNLDVERGCCPSCEQGRPVIEAPQVAAAWHENERRVDVVIGDADLGFVADSLVVLADLDEGEHTDDTRLRALATYLHTVRDGRLVPRSDLHSRHVSSVELDEPREQADAAVHDVVVVGKAEPRVVGERYDVVYARELAQIAERDLPPFAPDGLTAAQVRTLDAMRLVHELYRHPGRRDELDALQVELGLGRAEDAARVAALASSSAVTLPAAALGEALKAAALRLGFNSATVGESADGSGRWYVLATYVEGSHEWHERTLLEHDGRVTRQRLAGDGVWS